MPSQLLSQIIDNTFFLQIITILASFFAIVISIKLYLRYNRSTKQARDLNKLLTQRGIKTKLEHFDGRKHVDIFIPSACLSIEVDGIQHYLAPSQIKSDLDRSRGSSRQGVDTVHIPNIMINRHREQIARAIVQVVRKRKNYQCAI